MDEIGHVVYLKIRGCSNSRISRINVKRKHAPEISVAPTIGNINYRTAIPVRSVRSTCGHTFPFFLFRLL